METEGIGFAKIAQQVESIGQQKASGQLIIASGDRQSNLYFAVGRLLYATGVNHRVRRWFRALKQNSSGFAIDISKLSGDEPWEFQMIHQGLAQERISVTQAKGVINTSALEVFFSLARESDVSITWFSGRQPCPERFLTLPLSPEEVHQVIQQSQLLWKNWQEAGLTHLSPMLAPILRTSQPGQEKIRLFQLLNGKNTLWDIAFAVQRPVTTVARFLVPWVEQGKVELREVSDLPSPIVKRIAHSAPAQENLSAPLIACIDDSPVVVQTLEKILVPAGYRVLKITDPLKEMSMLVKNKPDLIFLDLIMPNTSGYSLCTFLRKTPVFQKTPIIILTSRDGIVDRTRAKLTGASDFLGKPPDADKVLHIVQKYLKVDTQKDTDQAAESGIKTSFNLAEGV